MAMTSGELREAFQRFFEERGHLRVPGHSLIPPADDPSTLFIVAGMQQFKPYFLRMREPPSKRVVSVQKVLRAGGKDTDLEDVGRTDRHNSFFEMMGNFSFGDYFKDEAVDFAWDWVTRVLQLDPERLWATVHEGDPMLELDEDTIAIEAWKRVGVPVERIVRLGKDNFWQAAETGPCGQCSEIFYDRGPTKGCGSDCPGPGHCDRYMEIYNLVFMGDLRPGSVLGGCRTRTSVPAWASNARRSCCKTSTRCSTPTASGRSWTGSKRSRESRTRQRRSSARTACSRHGRAVVPDRRGSTVERRPRLHLPAAVRRAIHQANRIGLRDSHRLSRIVVAQMGGRNAPGGARRPHRGRGARESFSGTLARGTKVFDELAGQPAISADDAFTLAATYGFPIELTEELAEERGQAVDVDGFRELMEGHRVVSRAGGDKSDLQRAAEFGQTAGFESEFVGYSKTDVLTQLGALEDLGNGTFLAKLRESPFYAESAGDRHRRAGARRDRRDRRAPAGVQARRRPGARSKVWLRGWRAGTRRVMVDALPDDGEPHGDAPAPRRARCSATTEAAGSAVRPDKRLFRIRRRSRPTACAGQRIVNEKVFEIPVRVRDADRRARKLGAMMLFGEVRRRGVVEIDGFSRELCGGTASARQPRRPS
jgi:alanyl-tRNA synthetase